MQRRPLAPLFARRTVLSFSACVVEAAATLVERLNAHDGEVVHIAVVETRAAIDEANRHYPPIVAISRVALEADELAGQPIRRGTMVVIAPYVLRRHRTLWSDPDGFDPNRFLGPTRQRIDRFAHLPFGAGPRVCIGAAMACRRHRLLSRPSCEISFWNWLQVMQSGRCTGSPYGRMAACR